MQVRRTFATCLLLGSLVGPLRAASPEASSEKRRDNAVTRWNEVAIGVFPREPGPILDGRAFAILHVALHDAVNGVERRYQPYTADLSSPGASVDAAVAAAARDVMVVLSPSHQDTVEKAYAEALDAIPSGPAKDSGVALGQQAAKANLERRAADGVPNGPWPPQTGPITQPVYVPNGRPGDYAFTPPFDEPPLGPIALFPGWGRLKPFVVDLAEHRAPGPDELGSAAYARDLNHLKAIGSLESTTRTADQTEIAKFWFEPAGTWQQIANSVLRQSGADTWRAARTLALMSLAVADADIVVFEAKYRFRFWRPYTAIRRADEDGNPRTEPDKKWLPLLWTPPEVSPPLFLIPPIPEYPSAASITSSAAAEVLGRLLGDRHSFEATSETLPGVTRRFRSVSQAARETRWSRVYGGIHFVRAIEDSNELGKRIGRSVSRMLPRVER
jgi:hypothetical protein